MAIIVLILESAQNGATKTKIMRNVALNHMRMNRYCTMMEKKDLLYYNSEDNIYETTPKGKSVLSACGQLFQFLRPVDQIVEKYRT